MSRRGADQNTATIKDVVKRCDYSACTVFRTPSGKGYLREETKQKVLETVVELGCRPDTLAVNLKTRCRRVLTLVLPFLTDIYYIKLEQYLEACTAEKSYIVYLNNVEYSLEKGKQILENLIGMDIAGVTITSVTSQHDHIMNLVKYDIPYVYLNHSFEDDIEHRLRLDNKRVAYKAVSYMIKLGHKNIDGIFQSLDNLIYRDRYDGMARALEEHGPDYHPSHMLFDINPEDMGITPGRTLRLLREPGHPEVILACNNMTAFNIYRACYIPGPRILDHLSVFGYDDCIVANFVTPPLPMVSTLVCKLAGTTTDFIHGHLEPGVRAEPPVLKVSLIIRNPVCNLGLD